MSVPVIMNRVLRIIHTETFWYDFGFLVCLYGQKEIEKTISWRGGNFLKYFGHLFHKLLHHLWTFYSLRLWGGGGNFRYLSLVKPSVGVQSNIIRAIKFPTSWGIQRASDAKKVDPTSSDHRGPIKTRPQSAFVFTELDVRRGGKLVKNAHPKDTLSVFFGCAALFFSNVFLPFRKTTVRSNFIKYFVRLVEIFFNDVVSRSLSYLQLIVRSPRVVCKKRFYILKDYTVYVNLARKKKKEKTNSKYIM